MSATTGPACGIGSRSNTNATRWTSSARLQMRTCESSVALSAAEAATPPLGVSAPASGSSAGVRSSLSVRGLLLLRTAATASCSGHVIVCTRFVHRLPAEIQRRWAVNQRRAVRESVCSPVASRSRWGTVVEGEL
eukprot:scaffold69530_cov30-Tisochrysis_lutea.AAC.3